MQTTHAREKHQLSYVIVGVGGGGGGRTGAEKNVSHTQKLQAQKTWEKPTVNYLYKTETSKN